MSRLGPESNTPEGGAEGGAAGRRCCLRRRERRPIAPGLHRQQPSETGSATVELALALPLLLALVLLVVQAGLVVADQVLLVNAAREAARAAAIDGNEAGAVQAAGRGGVLAPERLEVTVRRGGTHLTVELRYRSVVVVPLLRRALPDVMLTAELTMRDEAVAAS